MKAIALTFWITLLNPIVIAMILCLIGGWLSIVSIPYFVLWYKVNTRIQDSDPKLWKRVVGHW